MKAAAMSVWIFINLLFFGMCGYLYLIWSQYWLYIERQRYLNKPTGNPHKSNTLGIGFQEFYNTANHLQSAYTPSQFADSSGSARINRRSAVGGYWSSFKLLKSSSKSSGMQTYPSNNVVRKNGHPRFPNIHNPLLEFDSDKYACEDYSGEECETRTAEFKESLLKEFHRVLMSEGKVFKSGLEAHNTYNVQYKGLNNQERSGSEVLCALSKVPVRTVKVEDEPFRSQGFPIPDGGPQQGRLFNTCAVVTSAGALIGSRLGEFIDSHEMVLRFNNAPVANYSDDVGSKTTFRILNSQVVTKPEFKFLTEKLYRNISILIWDPANYSSTLEEWFHHPDFPLFPIYKKFLEEHTGADIHLLRPEILWDLWAVLQDSSPYRLRRNPPSSGFIGLWFSLHRCKRVRMFEYVPSVRVSRRCHYHVVTEDLGCTLGSWHPLAQEKALAESMRDNSDLDVFQRGFIDVPGFRQIQCG